MKKLIMIVCGILFAISAHAASFSFTSTTESGFLESDWDQIELFLGGHDTGDFSTIKTWKNSVDTESELKTLYNLQDADINTLVSAWVTANIGAAYDTSAELASLFSGKQDADADLTTLATPTAWRVFYSNGSGVITELALGADGTYLKSNGATSAPTFATPAGSGDVVGPASATDNAVVRYDSTTGKLIQNSGVTIDDSNIVTAAGFNTVPGSTPGTTWRDADLLGADEYAASIEINATTLTDGAEVTDMSAYYQDAGTKTLAWQIDGSENIFKSLISFAIIPTTSGDQTVTEGMIGQKSDEDMLVFHGGSTGEVQDEAGMSFIQHVAIPFDPAYAYDQNTNRILPLFTTDDDMPHGITITEWKFTYVTGDPTTEFAGDLVNDSDWTATGATVNDTLDTTAGVSTADTGFAVATIANGRNVFLTMDSDPTDANVQVLFELWYYVNED